MEIFINGVKNNHQIIFFDPGSLLAYAGLFDLDM
jgi:hypothetical protein